MPKITAFFLVIAAFCSGVCIERLALQPANAAPIIHDMSPSILNKLKGPTCERKLAQCVQWINDIYNANNG